MNNRTLNRLRFYASEVLEDIAIVGENTACAVIYEVINGVKTYTDYELAETDPKKYRELLDDDEKKEYDKVDKTGLETVNIIYNKEKIELMSLKDWLYLLTEAMRPDLSIDAIVILVNMNIQDVNDSGLAKSLNVTRQVVYQIFSNKRPVPQTRRQEIANILKFSVTEFDKVKQNPTIDLFR